MSADDSTRTALVTGASGFIGGRLAARLLDEDWSLRLLARNPARLPSALLRAGTLAIEGDLCDRDALARAVHGAQVVFHCAADVRTWDKWDNYHRTNVLGVQYLLDAIAAQGPLPPRLVHLSTVDVYGFPVTPCDEACPARGGEFGYGRSKALGEALVREHAALQGIPHTIIRPANVIGPGSQFIARMGAELRSGLMLTIDGGRANAGLLYVENLLDFIIWAAQDPGALGQCYNARDDYDMSWSEFIGRFRRAIRGKGVVVNLPFGVADGLARALAAVYRRLAPESEPLLHPLLVRIFGRTCGHSAHKIRSDSGIVGRFGFDEAIQASAQWFLQGTD